MTLPAPTSPDAAQRCRSDDLAGPPMTRAPEHPAPSEWRERVAAVMGEHGLDLIDAECTCGWKARRDRHMPAATYVQHRAHVASSLLPLLAEAQAEALRTEADKVEGAWQRHRDNGKRCCAASLYPLPDLIRASADRIGGEQR